jgi:hypothetical protein
MLGVMTNNPSGLRDGNAAQCRIFALFHGRIESVHIDVDDAAETRRQIGRMQHTAGDDITSQPA